MKELNGKIFSYQGNTFDWIVQHAYDLDTAEGELAFAQVDGKTLAIPGSDETVPYDPLERIGNGISVRERVKRCA